MEQKVSDVEASISSVSGFKVAGVHCGLKDNGALDFALLVSDRPCTAAAVFTTNQVKSAHVLVDMEKLKRNSTSIRAVAINTKCANACTGQQGIDNAYETARWIAEKLGCGEDQVLVMSTGVIGTQLPMDKIKRGVELSIAALGENNWDTAARAIMTTDTRPKLAEIQNSDHSGSKLYKIAGIAKGAGMIAPNMATMLSVVVTDAAFEPAGLQSMTHSGADGSFNRIVVDGDMSPNDTLLALANGASGVKVSGDLVNRAAQPEDTGWGFFSFDFDYVCNELARKIVMDGEGSTKFVTIQVKGAPKDFYDDQHHQNAAQKIANTIATSPLVKTAFYGNDANWGRIIAAAGRSGVPIDPEKLILWIVPGGVNDHWYEKALKLFQNGTPTNYSEAEATAIVSQPSFGVVLNCSMGDVSATVYTCDISHDYVSINGHYRT